MKLRTRIETVIDVDDWDQLVRHTYGRPYSFQQQEGCRERGRFHLSVPDEPEIEYENDTVPEKINDPEMGVSFNAWLKRDPKQPLKGEKYTGGLDLWWYRNFYPEIQVLANDLHAKGLLDAGQYEINIDW